MIEFISRVTFFFFFHEIVDVFLAGFCGLANKIFSELIL